MAKSRLIDALDAVTGGKLKSYFREAITAVDDDPRANEYRRFTDLRRDIQPLQYEQAMIKSFLMWQRNPLARRILDILVEFSTGDELQVNLKIKKHAQDGTDIDTAREDAQEVWDRFYKHPVNDLEHDMPMFALDYLLNGELVFPVTVLTKKTGDNQFIGDGTVLLGYYDPLNIMEVKTDPGNVRIVREIVLKPATGSTPITKTVVNHDMDPNSPTFGKLVGEVLYFRMNRVVNQARGHGELVDVLDWLDALEQFLFDALLGFQARNDYWTDVTMTGADKTQVDEMQKAIKAPQRGTIRVHNDKVTYEVKAPPLNATEVQTGMLAFQTFVVGNKGFPMTWFGTGENANRTSTLEMTQPTMRMLKAVQKTIGSMVKKLAYYVCDQAQIAGTLKLGTDEYIDVEIATFDFDRKEATSIGLGFTALVTALVSAFAKGWVSDESAKKVVDGELARLGIEIDPSETVEDNKANAATEDYTNVNAPQLEGTQPGAPPAPGQAGKVTAN